MSTLRAPLVHRLAPLASLAPLAAAVAVAVLPALARADTYENVTFDGPGVDEVLDGRAYVPDALGEHPPAVIPLHGCGGMWSDDDPSKGGVREIERWGRELAAQGYVVLAVDSYGGRETGDATWLEFQYQCNGTAYAGEVDPYTTRVDDIEAARQYLIDEYDIDVDGGVGLLGWSQGAQSVMIAMAATSKDSNVAYTGTPTYAGAVAFYPGCGSLLGFGLTSTKDGYWRPRSPMRLHHGTADSYEPTCKRRATNAINNYASGPTSTHALTWAEYAGVGHHFDNQGSTDFPAAKCDAVELATPGMEATCAMRDADVDSLAFFLDEVVAD
ncbi:MAG: dienelactone hydrolase family protein [Nannocystaceae bacterium]